MRYPVKLTPDDNGILMVTFPDVPEAATQGGTKEEALGEAVDALEVALDFYFETRRPVPMPSRPKRNQRTVDLPASVAAKVLLYNELLAQNVRPAELARRLNVPKSDISRLLNPRHTTKIDAIAAALGALGKRLEISVL